MVSLDAVFEYFNKSTIHGLNYFGDRERHWIERGFWIVTFTISMAGCFFMVHSTYAKWLQSPILISQDDKFTPVSEIPFPAVTICPTEKIGDIKVDLFRTFDVLRNFVFYKTGGSTESLIEDMIELSEADKASLNITDEGIRVAKAITMVCDVGFMKVQFVESDLKNFEIENLLKSNKPKWDKMVQMFMFKRSFFPTRFPWVLTEEGICFTFNSLGNFQIFKKDA